LSREAASLEPDSSNAHSLAEPSLYGTVIPYFTIYWVNYDEKPWAINSEFLDAGDGEFRFCRVD